MRSGTIEVDVETSADVQTAYSYGTNLVFIIRNMLLNTEIYILSDIGNCPCNNYY